jgi:cytochrome c oxidase cbb3-type subunit 2
MRALRTVGVPYSDDQIKSAVADLKAQSDPMNVGGTALERRYGGKINRRNFDDDPDRITELSALIAYLQVLGTEVDFSTYHAEAPANQR